MNPFLIPFFKSALPYAAACALGCCAAFYLQGVRLQAAKNELVSWQQAATAQQQEESAKAQKLNEDIADAYRQNLDALHAYYAARRVRTQPLSLPACRLPAAAGSPDGEGANPLPDPARLEEDCAVTTLQLDMLQDWVREVGK